MNFKKHPEAIVDFKSSGGVGFKSYFYIPHPESATEDDLGELADKIDKGKFNEELTQVALAKLIEGAFVVSDNFPPRSQLELDSAVAELDE